MDTIMVKHMVKKFNYFQQNQSEIRATLVSIHCFIALVISFQYCPSALKLETI
jgi:hypothetical protein